MNGLYMALRTLSWRQPWTWPRALQSVFFLGGGLVSVLLLSPWWMSRWQAWHDAKQAQDKLHLQQEAAQALRVETAALLQTQIKIDFVDAGVLTQLAHQHGLQVLQFGLDKPVHTPALNALHMQQLPVHLRLQGAWTDWVAWLAEWPTSAPGVSVSSLELNADPRGGISAQLVALMPQSTLTPSSLALKSGNSEKALPTDPFSTQSWTASQRAYAEQHPSYAQRVVPELMRPRDPLESYPLERLQYVGQIASGAEIEALVQVLPHLAAKKEVPMASVHRVRVGAYLGQDFGRVQSVASERLVLQELVLTPTGEWQPREVNLPLKESVP